jgi:hypothetical protein
LSGRCAAGRQRRAGERESRHRAKRQECHFHRKSFRWGAIACADQRTMRRRSCAGLSPGSQIRKPHTSKCRSRMPQRRHLGGANFGPRPGEPDA